MSVATEAAIIGSLLEMNGAEWPPNLAKLLAHAPESFDDERHGLIAVTIRKLKASGRPVHTLSIVESCDLPGISILLGNLAAAAVSLEIAESEASAVWARYHARRLKTVFAEATAAMESAPDKADLIADGVRHSLDALDSKGKQPNSPPVARPLSELVRPEKGDPGELLQFRFLCRQAGLLLCGPTGVGKSSFGLQCAILWALARECFGIKPMHALKSLFIQAENDDGDLAEMRDGIFTGLRLTATQRDQAAASVIVAREDERTGLVFLNETVRPLLSERKPDLLWADPMLAYLGGETNSQRDVGGFLRNGLNPLLREFNCGFVGLHHTNKPPSGKEKPKWTAGDFAYLGAGSAEWANWARAVLALRSIGSREIFELQAGKRGGRLGWHDAHGEKAFVKYLAHSKTPGEICWREIEADELETGGRPKSYDIGELVDLLPGGGLATGEWERLAKSECGISRATFHRERQALTKANRVLKSKVSGKWQPIKSA